MTPAAMDRVLEPFLAAPDAESDERLGDLLANHATPVIRRVVFSRLGRSCTDVDDVSSQVLMQLLLRLRQGKADEGLSQIETFGGYAAAAAHHGCDHYFRRKYPLRWRLRNRLRYVLEHDRRLDVWKSAEGAWVCGLAMWNGCAAVAAPAAEDVAQVDARQPQQFLLQLFQTSRGPLELNIVVDLAAEVWRVPLFLHEDNSAIEAVPDRQPGTDVMLGQRREAERVWDEIRGLPLRQRQALLLNLKDDAMGLFLMTGTASLRGIAETLDMPVETLAAQWNDLPLADNVVAARLGCTRQQVINLRMAARKRLANRVAGWS